MTIEELAARMDEKFAGVDQKVDRMDQRFDALERQADEGFNASRARDEELRDLTKFGLEARESLRDEMHRRFDAADRKRDEAISLLETAVRDSSRRK